MAIKPKALQIGNTTFRRPWRIPEGLRALKEFNKKYNFKDNRKSKEYEVALIKSISKTGILESEGKDESWDGGHGRKFLNFCQKFGFITPRPGNVRGKGIYDLNKNGEDNFIIEFLNNSDLEIERNPFSLTPLGNLLADTESKEYEITSEQQDIFLKSLYYQLQPSVLHSLGNKYNGEIIRPLQLFLKIFFKLEELKMEPTLSSGEIALVVNPSWTNNINKIISDLKIFREQKKGKERKFSREWFQSKGGNKTFKIAFDTIWTYADPNMSYLVSTGLIHKIGRKIILNNNKIKISKKISEEANFNFKNDYEYLSKFWSGGLLPFENEEYLINQANANNKLLKSKYNYIDTVVPDKKNIKTIIYKTEDKIKEFEEIEFFKSQKNSINEIIKTLEDIDGGNISYNGIEFEPEPEHLEWIVWRAFLSINSFINEIKNTRGFPVDNSFLPTHHAKAGREDLFFEFNKFKLLVEVTFKVGSAQHKDEYEPVYRHTVKRMEEDSQKPIYCLFIAPKISNNLAKDFKSYIYNKKDEKVFGNIVPVEIKQFTKLFKNVLANEKKLNPDLLKNILDEVLNLKKSFEPIQWLKNISKIINEKSAKNNL